MRDPIHGIIANLFSLQRLGTGITRETDALLRALFDDLVAQIAKIDPTAVARRTFRRKRLETLLGEIETLVGQEVPKLRSLVRKRLIEIGGQQAEWATTQLEGTIGVVGVVGENRITPKFFRAIVDEDPFQGETLRSWFRSIQDSTIRRIRRQLQLGMAQNETIDDMVRRVRGRRVGRRFRGGVMQATTRDAETVVRTGVNHIANRAHHEVHRANADIVTRIRYVATLDSRTSDVCIALDGKEWEPDDPDIRLPPQHPNCRSITIARPDWKALGLPEPPEGTRASADGPVPSSTTYEQWLKGQPPAVQDEILGPTRAKLFRDGKINLRDLVRTDGSSVTVAELRGPGSSGDAPRPPRKPPAKTLRADITQREDEIRDQPVEWGTVWDAETGRRIIEKTNNKPNQLTFTMAEVDAMKDNILTHNHPRSSSFSPDDVQLAVFGDLREIRIVSERYDYQMRRPEGGWPKIRVLRDEWRAADVEVEVDLLRRMRDGGLEPEEARVLHWHRVWALVFDRLGFRGLYRRRKARGA